MITKYIPQIGDLFEAFEKNINQVCHVRNRSTGKKEEVEINLTGGHKACDGPFLGMEKTDSSIMANPKRQHKAKTPLYRFNISWYDFQRIESATDGKEKSRPNQTQNPRGV